MELNEEFAGLSVELGNRPHLPHLVARRGILVVGSHRSGTSALTRVLSLVGCDLPKRVLAPHADNEAGFWEPQRIVEAHEAYLENIDLAWDDVMPLADGAFVSPAALELRRQLALLVHEEYGTSPLFVVKDPRISRLLPLWFAVLADLQIAPGTVIAVRNPLEVAASLKARNNFTTTKSLLLWLRYTLESEQHSRGHLRSIVMYDKLLRDWRGVVTEIGRDLGIRWPGTSHRAAVEAEHFLSEQHRHYRFDWSDLESRADVVGWVKEAYFALRDSDPLPTLDQVRSELSEADTAFGPIVEEVRLAVRSSQNQMLEAAAARDALAADLETRNAELQARTAEVGQLQAEVARLGSAASESESRLVAHEAEVNTVRGQRDVLAAEIGALRTEVEQLVAAVEGERSRAASAEVNLAEARQNLEAVSAEREQLLAHIEGAGAQINRFKGEADAAKFALLTAETEAADVRAELLRQIHAADTQIEGLASRLAQTEQFATRSQEEAAAAKTECDALTRERDQSAAEAKRLSDDNGRLREAVQRAALDSERLHRELSVLRSVSARRGRQRARAEHLLAAAQKQLVSSEKKTLRARDEALEWAKAAASARQHAKRLEREISAATTNLDSIAQQLNALEARFEGRDAEVSRLLLVNQKLQDELAAVRLEVRDESSEAVVSNAADLEIIAQLRVEVERLHADVTLRGDEVANLMAALSEREDEQASLKQSLDLLRGITQQRAKRRKAMSQFASWLFPPRPSGMKAILRYWRLRQSGFDADAYLLRYPDVASAGLSPFMHYAEHGYAEGRAVDALDAPTGRSTRVEEQEGEPAVRGSESDVQVILASGLFSPAHYQQQLTSAGIGFWAEDQSKLARHYLLHGERAGLTPSLLFDPDWYAAEYPDALRYGNLLLHFIEFGDVEHRSPHPLFDPAFYTRQATSPIQRPYAHFRAQPESVSYSPHPMLDLRHFLGHRNWDVDAVRDPFLAFLEDVTDDAFLVNVFQGPHYARQLAEHFNPQRHNVLCYMKRSRVENVSAHPAFDAEFYLRAYPDVEASGSHTYLHYLLQGRDEGRLAQEALVASEASESTPQSVPPAAGIARACDLTPLRPTDNAFPPTPVISMPLDEPATSSIASREAALRAEVAGRFRLDRGTKASLPRSHDLTISFLMPVFRPPLVYLDRAIRSVLQQSFGNWQLCIVDDASQDPAVSELLRSYASTDARIRVAQAAQNGGIAQATNSALAMAKGEYVGLLDHDDMLTVDAVEIVMKRLAAEPDTDFLYSDECTLDTNDVPLEFFSKPDWSPFLLLSSMYTGHLSVYRRALVEAVGGFRSRYDFSQDYDLALRVAETNPVVHHVPRCLYGWRSIPESAAQDGKPHARASNIAALQDALERRAIPGVAEALPGSNRFLRHPSARAEFVSIIIPSDDLAKIRSAVLSIRKSTSYSAYEIIVVTNSRASEEVSRSMRAVQCVKYDRPFNFSDKCNEGARVARGSRLVFFNDDVEVLSEDWLDVLLDTISLDEVGAVAPRLVYGDGSLQHAGMVTGVRRFVGTAFHGCPPDSSENFGLPQYAREVSVVSAACLMVAADLFSSIGGFDSEHTPIEHSDVDFCLRIREQGLTCVYTPFATLRHLGHQSLAALSEDEQTSSRSKADLYLLERWPHRIAYDPYFPPQMRDLHFRDSQEPFTIYPGLRSATSEVRKGVLLVSHDLSNSGAPRNLVDLGRVLKDAGCYVCVCAPADGPMRERFTAEGIDVVVDELLLTDSPWVLDFASAFDFGIANTAVTWRFVERASAVLPVYWFFQESELIAQLARENREFVSALRVAAGVWALGPLTARQLRKLGAPVQMLTPGIDTTRIPQGRRRESGPIVIGVFGSYEPRKGQDLAVSGVLEMPPEIRSEVRLETWGRVLDAPFYRDVQRMAAGCDEIYIGPELPAEACLRQLANSDVVLVPSRDDALAMVALDALACSRILVVSRATGASEFVEHGVSALILEENSPQEIAKTLIGIVQQRELYPEVRAAARDAFGRHFSWQRFTAQVHDLLTTELSQLHPPTAADL